MFILPILSVLFSLTFFSSPALGCTIFKGGPIRVCKNEKCELRKKACLILARREKAQKHRNSWTAEKRAAYSAAQKRYKRKAKLKAGARKKVRQENPQKVRFDLQVAETQSPCTTTETLPCATEVQTDSSGQEFLLGFAQGSNPEENFFDTHFKYMDNPQSECLLGEPPLSELSDAELPDTRLSPLNIELSDSEQQYLRGISGNEFDEFCWKPRESDQFE